ncbi:Glycine cleavage system H protein [Staphylococcus aureus]|nr:Glycine cleavage system H protein [Staphylococcus aureus]CXQ20339.1 Glycine cleavage system H protein [Staphylococcus aureus]CXQ30189.1 Glycine cleavage system H protein [Staphylococcus aureus]CXS09419.1 Glycine cleavage system H protein [Staphylococcus aureus]CXW02204.1 Glycine cleavage system H protein [Staphylococcus aureus]
MKKLANYLWVEKVGDLYVFSMTPELQDDIGTVGYVEFVSPDEVKVDDEIVSIEASKTVIDVQTRHCQERLLSEIQKRKKNRQF